MKSKHLVKALGVAFSAILVVAVLASAAQAKKPAAPYEQFAGCPSKTENAEMSSCLHSVVKSGSFKMGNKEVPIEKPIPLSGGTNSFLQHFSFNSEGGLKPVPQKVPGGVVGITGLTWLVEFLGSEALTLYAVTELAGTPEFLGTENITLPIKVHLVNAVLGNKCYVGSSSSPIVLHLSTETAGGKAPELTFTEEPAEILFLKNGTYVDDTFAAPGANGCALTLFGFIPISINGIVNTASGLPAASGTNKAVQNIDSEVADVRVVYPPSGF